jgi:hypothetical protein
MGRAGLERARALYGPEAHAARVEEIYAAAIRRWQAGGPRA